jgi:hypothetical protein
MSAAACCRAANNKNPYASLALIRCYEPMNKVCKLKCKTTQIKPEAQPSGGTLFKTFSCYSDISRSCICNIYEDVSRFNHEPFIFLESRWISCEKAANLVKTGGKNGGIAGMIKNHLRLAALCESWFPLCRHVLRG